MKPTTKLELVNGINSFWATVDENKCCHYINHLRKVIPKVIEVNGELTSYTHYEFFDCTSSEVQKNSHREAPAYYKQPIQLQRGRSLPHRRCSNINFDLHSKLV